MSLIKRTADAVIKGRSGKWEGASFVGKNREGKRRMLDAIVGQWQKKNCSYLSHNYRGFVDIPSAEISRMGGAKPSRLMDALCIHQIQNACV